MPTNDFIGFASSGSANIMTQAAFAAAAEQTAGVQPGPASSKLANKVWRQGANMAAALGSIIKAKGGDALDDGDIATLTTTLTAALAQVAKDAVSVDIINGTHRVIKFGALQIEFGRIYTDANSPTAFTFTNPFAYIPAVTFGFITTNASSPSNFRLTDLTATGFDYDYFNSGGTHVSGASSFYIAIGAA